MTRRFSVSTFWLVVIYLVAVPSAHAIRALDDNYLAPANPPSNSNGVEVLSPNFFDDTSGSLPKAEEGKFACTSVWSRTAQGESAAIGKVAQNFCGSATPQVKWVPKMQSWTGVPQSYNNNDAVGGYFHVCCHKQTGRKAGRYRAR